MKAIEISLVAKRTTFVVANEIGVLSIALIEHHVLPSNLHI